MRIHATEKKTNNMQANYAQNLFITWRRLTLTPGRLIRKHAGSLHYLGLVSPRICHVSVHSGFRGIEIRQECKQRLQNSAQKHDSCSQYSQAQPGIAEMIVP